MDILNPTAGSTSGSNIAVSASNDAVFRDLPETLFSRNTIKTDADHLTRDFARVSAQSGNCYGSIENPINGNRIKFEYIRTAGAIDLRNSYFLIGVQFSNAGKNAVALCAPDPFAIGTCFSEFRMSINQNTTEIYRQTIRDCYPCFAANMLMNYTAKELNKHPSLFLPFDNMRDQLQMGDNGPVGATYAGATSRATNWCSSHTKVHYIPLFFTDLLPRIENGCYNNLSVLTVEAQFNSFISGALTVEGQRMLFPFSSLSHARVHDDRSHIVFCEMFVSLMQTEIPRQVNRTEVIAFNYPLMYRKSLSAGNCEISIPNIKNLQSIFMFRPTSLNAGDVNMRVLVATPAVPCASHSNFVMLDSGGAVAQDNIDSADKTAQTNAPIEALSVRYAEYEIPMQNVNLQDGATKPAFENLYHLYALSTGRLGSCFPTAVGHEYFCRKMPFISIAIPSKGDYATRSPNSDLLIRLTGVARIQEVYIILYCLRAIVLGADGRCFLQE